MPSYAHIITITALVALVVLLGVYLVMIHLRKTQTVEAFKSNETRPCSVYYLEKPSIQKKACDKGLYKHHPLTIKYRWDELNKKVDRTNDETKEMVLLQTVLDYPLKNQACKFTFDNWKEKGSDEDIGQDANNNPLKNDFDKSNTARGPPKRWAYCFGDNKQFDRRTFQNSSAVKLSNSSGLKQPRIQFHTFDYKKVREAYCKTSRNALDYDVPNAETPAFLRIPVSLGKSVTSNPTLSNVSVVVTQQNGSLKEFVDPYAVYRKLFTIHYIEGRRKDDVGTMVMYPRKEAMVIYRLTFDECGGVQQTPVSEMPPNRNNTYQIRFDTLVGELKLMKDFNKRLLINVPRQYGEHLKTIESFRNRTQTLLTTMNNNNTEIDTLTKKIAELSNRVDERQGLRQRRYHPWPWIVDQYSGALWTPEGTQRFVNEVKTRFTPDESHITNINWPREKKQDHKLFIVDGFIKLSAGEHTFQVVSDDAGQLFISSKRYEHGTDPSMMNADVLISSHLGMNRSMEYWQNRVAGTKIVKDGEEGYYKVEIRWIEGKGREGYHIYYSFNKGGGSIINNNMFFTLTVPSTKEERDKKKQLEDENVTLNAELDRLIDYRKRMINELHHKVKQIMDRIPGKGIPSTLPYDMLSNDGAFYIWPGQLGIPLRAGAVAVSDAQYITEPIMDISKTKSNIVSSSIIESDPFIVNLQEPPQYTVMMWIKVDEEFNDWRRIFLHGKDNSDRTPGLWIYPDRGVGKVQVHFRHSAQRCKESMGQDWNCGLDLVGPTGKLTDYGKWFHFAVTIQTDATKNSSVVKLYYNGKLHRQAQLHDHNKFDWNQVYGKKLYIGHVNSDTPVYIQKAKWYSMVKSSSDILKEFNESSYIKNSA